MRILPAAALALTAILGISAYLTANSSIAATSPAPASPVAATQFSDEQKAAIEEMVRDLLIKKDPDIVMMAAQEAQSRQEKAVLEKGKKSLGENRDKVFNDPTSPVGGNPKGDVTVVEFFDYQCGYCKVAQNTVSKLVAEDKNIKLIYKEFPILGQDSLKASKAALAAARQGKYQKFHDVLMSKKERISDEAINSAAKEAGLDVEKMKKDAASEEIGKIISANVDLGTMIGARGTPTFVVGDQIFPGVMELEQFKKVIAETRQGSIKK